MHIEFSSKIQQKKHTKKEFRLLIALICFAVAMILLVVYSAHNILALFVPFVYVCYRLYCLHTNKGQLRAVLISFDFFNTYFEYRETDEQITVVETVMYKDIVCFEINKNGWCELGYHDNGKKIYKSFYVPQDSVWELKKQIERNGCITI